MSFALETEDEIKCNATFFVLFLIAKVESVKKGSCLQVSRWHCRPFAKAVAFK